MSGRTIRLYLVDGTATGILTAEIINWTGKAILAPRSQLSDLASRQEARRTGIYILAGPDPEQPGREKIYIGEGDSVLTRLVSHDRDPDKDFWTRAVVVISKDDNITKSHGRFLESRVIAMARQAGRANVDNGTAPDTPVLPESDIADMEYFLEQVQTVLPVLGMSFLQPHLEVTGTVAGGADQSPRFVMNDVGTRANAVESGEEFVVLQGSTARVQGVISWTSYRALRDGLVSEGKLVPSNDPEYYVFTENVAFTSPSAAAATVAARNTNGRLHWRVEETGQTYADWHQAKLDAVGANEVDGEQT